VEHYLPTVMFSAWNLTTGTNPVKPESGARDDQPWNPIRVVFLLQKTLLVIRFDLFQTSNELFKDRSVHKLILELTKLRGKCVWIKKTVLFPAKIISLLLTAWRPST